MVVIAWGMCMVALREEMLISIVLIEGVVVGLNKKENMNRDHVSTHTLCICVEWRCKCEKKVKEKKAAYI